MGYAVYRDPEGYNRWAGYGVPAVCDMDDCIEEIHRGLGYKCEEHILYPKGDEDFPEREEEGCGLYFCESHRYDYDEHEDVQPKDDSLEWILFMILHESWAVWREENPETTRSMREKFDRANPEAREKAREFVSHEIELESDEPDA